MDQWVSTLSILGMCLITVGIIFLTFEAGFFLGKNRYQRSTKEKDSLVGPMVGSILGLLAFMLSFTFGVAASHFDTRRHLVLDEANVIRSTYAMTGLLGQDQRDEARKLLREYVDIRVKAVQSWSTVKDREAMLARSNEIQDQLWSMAMIGQIKNTGTSASPLYQQSLDEMINMQAKRITAVIRSRIPTTIWVVLYALVIFGMAAMGYHSGLIGIRGFFVYQALILTFSFVLVLIYDLDRPKQGLFKVSQQAMVELQKKMIEPSAMFPLEAK